MRVLIVDDSLSFRSQIKRALKDSRIEIVGSASNGRVAIDLLLEDNDIDIVTLDMNMPVMDGLETIKEIKRLNLSPKIIVFASKTDRSAKETLEALNLGADDFIVKPEAKNVTFENAHKPIQEELLPKIINLGSRSSDIPKNKETVATSYEPVPFQVPTQTTVLEFEKKSLAMFQPEIVLIASSTGGPSALEVFFKSIVGRPPKVPILIAQHMPANFTKHLADRLCKLVGYPVKEAEHRETPKPGVVYICPGNFHMRVKRINDVNRIILDQEERVKNVRPCAELLFESVVSLYGSTTMGFVLTGMGDDGVDGCQKIKESDGGVMIQDEKSSTVWGMPGAVYGRGVYDEMGSLEECSQILKLLVS